MVEPISTGVAAMTAVQFALDLLSHLEKEEQLEIARINLEASNRAEVRDVEKLELVKRAELRDQEKLKMYGFKTAMDYERYCKEYMEYTDSLFTSDNIAKTKRILRGLGMERAFGYISIWIIMNDFDNTNLDAEKLKTIISNITVAEMKQVFLAYFDGNISAAFSEVLNRIVLESKESERVRTVEEDFPVDEKNYQDYLSIMKEVSPFLWEVATNQLKGKGSIDKKINLAFADCLKFALPLNQDLKERIAKNWDLFKTMEVELEEVTDIPQSEQKTVDDPIEDMWL